jgi:hypothetical protein
MLRRVVVLLVLGLAAGCGGEATLTVPSASAHDALGTPARLQLDARPTTGSLVPVRRAADGSLRVRFAGGELATWNDEMPHEIEQVAAGQRPDRPVVVWAGQDAVDATPGCARTR